MNLPRVSIIILNWNGWQDTIECIESLTQIAYDHYDIIIVDNGSIDDSIKKIKQYANGSLKVYSKFINYVQETKPLMVIEYTENEAMKIVKENEIENTASNRRFILIRNENNYGFAVGNNVGIKYAIKILNPDYILLLNNDTIVDKYFLSGLVKAGQKFCQVGIVGPMILSYYNEDIILTAGGEISKLTYTTRQIGFGKNKNKKIYNIEREVDYVSGCALMIKTEVINSIGLLDPRYFMYVEEKDWTTRARMKGYRCVFAPQSVIWHKASISANKINGLQEYYSIKGQILYLKKFINLRHSTIAFPMFFLQRLCIAIIKRDVILLKACFEALIDGLSGNYQKKW